MDAGRELDALIAEKVMGWRLGDYYWLQDDAAHPGRGRVVAYVGDEPPFSGGRGPRFAPSTDIAAAWQVVEHMNRKVPNEFQMMSEHGGYTAEFAEGRSCWSETAPLAICRAALAAVAVSR